MRPRRSPIQWTRARKVGPGSDRDARTPSCVLWLSRRRRSADEQFDVGASPVLNVQLSRGHVTDTDMGSAASPNFVRSTGRRAASRAVSRWIREIPKQIQIASQAIQTAHGLVTLPAESFVLPEIPGTQHDAIVARGNGQRDDHDSAQHGDSDRARPCGTADAQRLSRRLRRTRRERRDHA